jgi:hypothetical protein
MSITTSHTHRSGLSEPAIVKRSAAAGLHDLGRRPVIRRLRIALAAVAALACLAPAAASASPKVEKRTFKVEIKGYQNNRWDFHHVAESKCDQTVQSSGHEYLSFATRRPVTLEVLRIGDSVVFGTRRSDVNGINLRVRIDRGATHTASPLDPTCTGTNGGGAEPGPAQDCGVRQASLDVRLEWWHVRRAAGLTLNTGTLFVPIPPYRNCPVGGTSFPELLETVNGRQIISPAEAADLFDVAFKKHVLLGNGRYHNGTTDGSSTTKLHWAVTLTAVD